MVSRRLRFLAASLLALLILLTVSGGVWAAAATSYGVYVQDEASVLSEPTRQSLYAQAVWLKEQTGTAQIGVVALPDLGGRSLEEAAVTKFRELGLGDKERNDGVLLIYSKQDNRVRIEVGYGMEGRIPDGKAGAILDQYFVPNRDAGRLEDAFFQTQSALIVEMAAEYNIDASSVIGSGQLAVPEYGQQEPGLWSSIPAGFKWVGGIVLVLLIILDFKFTGGAVTYAIFSMIGRGRGSSGGGGGGGGGGRGGGGSSGGGGASR
jgi:uncharacterized protein